MFENARCCGLVAGALVGAVAGVVGLACATASAEPVYPQPPSPITQSAGLLPVAGAQSAAGTQSIAGAQYPAAAAAPAAPPGIVPATSVTIVDFLKGKHVSLEPQVAKEFKALNIVLPMPTGWSQVPDPNVPDAFAVIADRVGGDGLYTSNAALVVYKLVGGEFDPKEAISHGLIDSQQQPAWRVTDASLADYGGMPSAAIRGHLPAEQSDAHHHAQARARHLRTRQVPGDALGDQQRRGGGRLRSRDRCDRPRVQGRLARHSRACTPGSRGNAVRSGDPRRAARHAADAPGDGAAELTPLLPPDRPVFFRAC